MAKKPAKRPKARKPHLLDLKERIVVYNQRGSVVERPRPGRNYVVHVFKGKRRVRTINSLDKAKKPIPRPFTTSMLARLKYTKRIPYTQAPKRGGSYKLTNKRRIKSQLSDKMIREIRRNKGKAFSFRVKFGQQDLVTHQFYFSGRMGEDQLKNLITSDLLYILGRDHFRISPKLETETDKKTTKRISEAQLEVQFNPVEKAVQRKKQNERARPKSRRKTARRKR